jgi:UDP-glucose 4-epimerase
MKKIIVTGGAGYIGSHCVLSLVKNSYTPIIIDNFSNSYPNVIKKIESIIKKKVIFYKLDIKNKKKLKLIFKKHKCQAVIHLAGYKSVKESNRIPITYFNNNIQSTLSLLECMKENKVYDLIFSSSGTVYNQDEKLPWKETSQIGKTTNPYGTTKYIIERILFDIGKSDSRWNIKIARYFNPIGNHPSGLIGDNSKGIPNNLLPYIVKVAQKKLPYLNVYGKNYITRDGTCIRDFIHVMDLAEGHIAMLKKNKFQNRVEVYNFGTGKGSTVLEVLNAFEKETGIHIPFRFAKRREGDVPISLSSSNKAFKKLFWKPKLNLNHAIIDIKKTLDL